MARQRNHGGSGGPLSSPMLLEEHGTSPDNEASSSSACCNNHNHNPSINPKEPCVLILTSWSPGPLPYIFDFLAQQYPHVHLLRPRRIDMPPVSAGWWCNVRFLVMASLFCVFGWLARTACRRTYERHGASSLMPYYQCVALFVLMGLVWIKAMVAEVIRNSMQRNLAQCQAILAQHKVVLVIGFSWGAAIAAEMVAQGLLGDIHNGDSGDDDDDDDDTAAAAAAANLTPCLLIAPTTSLISKLSVMHPYRTDAALRIRHALLSSTTTASSSTANNNNETTTAFASPPNHNEEEDGSNDDEVEQPGAEASPTRRSQTAANRTTPRIHVVHALGDAAFCPHPEHWWIGNDGSPNHQYGSKMLQLTLLRDNHVFLRRSSEQEIIGITGQMMRLAIGNNNTAA